MKYLYLSLGMLLAGMLLSCSGEQTAGVASGTPEGPAVTQQPSQVNEAPAGDETALTGTDKEDKGVQIESFPTPLPTEPPGSGAACLGTADGAVACLTAEGEWLPFTSDDSPLGGDTVTDMTVCPDGTILMAHYSGISAWDGASWREYTDGWGSGSADGIACDAGGGIWVAHFRGASYFDGREWITFGPENFDTGEDPSELINDIALGPDGRVWLVTSNTIASYDGQRWTPYEEGNGLDDLYFFEAITVGRDGRVWAGSGDGLLTGPEGGWQLFEAPGYAIVEDIVVGPDGTVWTATFSEGLQQFDGGWRSFGDDLLTSGRINQVVFDRAGRIWVGTDYGLNVFDGSAWRQFLMADSGLPDNEIISLAVVGSGPLLPSLLEKESGSMSGRLLLAGEPIAGSQVEICVEPLSSFLNGKTPCEGQPFVRSTTTDGEGGFFFEELPEGFYVVAADTGDGWAILTNDFGFGSERVPVAAGEETRMGELFIEEEE